MEETLTEEKVIEGVDNSPSQMVDYNPDNMISILVYKSYDHIIKHENIPKEMIMLDQWCYWKIEEKNGKESKVPYYKKSGQGTFYADSTKKSTWKNFAGVHGSVSFSVNGIGPGFMLSVDDPYCLIDLDDCLIQNKEKFTWDIEPWAAKIIEKFNSYTEISSSGEGIHIIVKAKLDAEGRKKGKIDEEGHEIIEIYDRTHMIAFTGWVPDNFKREIRDCQNEAIELQSKIIETGNNNPDNPNLGKSPTFEDEEIIELGLHEKTDKFCKLFKEGDYSDYNYPSQSEADQALCNKIAFYTQNPEQIDRIFRQSALMREKWENRDDYRTDTIKNAINGLTAVYQRPAYNILFNDLTVETGKGGSRFSPSKSAESLLQKVPLAIAEWDTNLRDAPLWTCDGETNIWKKNGCFLVERICDKTVGDLSNKNVIADTKRRITNELRSRSIEFDTGNPSLVGTQNGFACDLITGEVRKISQEDHISEELMLPVNYNPSAKCPNIFNFYDSICSDDCSKMAFIDDDAATLDLRAWHYITLLLGQGGNGKGERMRLKRAFFGAHTFADIQLKDLNKSNFAGSELYRKRVLHCGEAKRTDKGERYDTSVLKIASGDDQVSFDQKFKERLNFVPFCKICIDTNNPPVFDDNSNGFKRRFRRINTPFTFVDNPDPSDITQKQKDEGNLARITTEEELSGYLNVLLARSKEIASKRKYPSCTHLTQGYEKQVYSIEEFINQFCEIEEDSFDKSIYASVSTLYSCFQSWAKLSNSASSNPNAFGRTFGALIGRRSENKRVNEKVQKVYYGVKFNEEACKQAINIMEEKINLNDSEESDCIELSDKYRELKSIFGEDFKKDDSW